MGDSEDEYDRKRRDKFRGERAEASYRGAERAPRPREDWVERDNWSRPRPREYRPRDRGYSPSIEPAPKRMRHDYYGGEGAGYYNHYGPYHQASHREPPGAAAAAPGDGQQPPMMSFKSFLATQDDNISDSEAIEKYNEYKLEFQRHQLNEFFVAHKDDEWFRLKYHPEESVKRREEQSAALKRRLDVFVNLLASGKIASTTVDCSQTTGLLKLLDTVVIKLEGGTDDDLDLLENEYREMEAKYHEQKEKEAKKNNLEELKEKVVVEEEEVKKDEVVVEEKAVVVEIPKDEEVVESKRKRSVSSSSASSEGKAPAEEPKEEENVEKPSEVAPEEEIQVIPDEKPEKPKALHKTTSIFLRNLAPTITKQEVEAICSRYEGFLRVALADPQPERRWLRRGWVTFKRDSNIKEICWNLNNIRLRECELGAIVNRDLSRRIRPVNGIVAHKQVVRSDIRIAAKVTLHLDQRAGLWLENSEEKQETFGLMSNNPVLRNITDYLIEEASAEEEELLGLEPTTAESQENVGAIERDESLIGVLDKIVLYLRIVHSVDYYNHCEYPNEDEMPNRCGILHARGPPPTSKTDMTQFIGAPIETKMANFLPEKPQEEKDKNEPKLIQMALKDVETEVDKFVQVNTKELAKDKWLCPLSGKKFKGPDFVRKHIFNKHSEKIDEVKKEVEFFNNYLRDPKRPVLAEPAPAKREEPATLFGHPGYGGGGYGAGGGGYGSRPQHFFNQGGGGGFPPRSRGYTPRGRGGGDFGRPIIHYRDLDAPREPEEFI